MHVRLDHESCLEFVAERGQGRIIANMAGCMLGLEGVRHGKLTYVAVERSSVTQNTN